MMCRLYFENSEESVPREIGFVDELPPPEVCQWLMEHLFPVDDEDYGSGEHLMVEIGGLKFYVDDDFTWKIIENSEQTGATG